jgi:hypothetical protein
LESKTHLLKAEFGIGAEHGLDIAYRDADGQFFAWNNDSYDNPRSVRHLLPGDDFIVEVALEGVWVNESFRFHFAADGDYNARIVKTD